MKKAKRLSARQSLLLSLVAVLLFMGMASLILHDFGNVEIKTEYIETTAGTRMAVKVFRPKTATAETPAPAVIFVHGLACNKETYSNYALELSRRGFVVLTPDMTSHGQSAIEDVGITFSAEGEGFGTYSVVRYAQTLDYVDQTQIGMGGHSSGGAQTNTCVMLDNMSGQNAISAVFLIASDPAYTDGSAVYTNYYGSRDVGMFYTMYDHVFYTTTSESGEVKLAQQYLTSDSAKSFVTAGGDPAAFDGDTVVPGHYYVNDVDGENSFRVIIAAKDIHASGEVNPTAIGGCVDFYQNSFTAPNYIEGAEQIWGWYSLFSFGALAVMIVFAYYLIKTLTQTKAFASLHVAERPVLGPAPDRNGKLWFWGLTIATTVFSILSISVIYSTKFSYWLTPLFPQQMTNAYAFWGAINGLFMALTIFIAYRCYARKHGVTLKDWGLAIGWKNFFKSIALALIVIACFVVFVQFSVKVLGTDFRYYMWGITVIPFDSRILVFLTYLPLFLCLCFPLCLSVNYTYYQKIGNEPEWLNDIFFAVVNSIPAALITAVGFHIFIKNGYMPHAVFGSTFTHTYTINAIPMFPLVVLAVRRLRKVCNNPYIPALISAVLLCWMNVSCAYTAYTTLIGMY